MMPGGGGRGQLKMRIGELSERSGCAVETIRFYEKRGLLPEPVRLANNYRSYGSAHLVRLHFIRHCRSLGLGLPDIARLVSFNATDPDGASAVHGMIERHIETVSMRIRELERLREHLRGLQRRCLGHRNGEPCGILLGLEEDAEKGVCTCCLHGGGSCCCEQ